MTIGIAEDKVEDRTKDTVRGRRWWSGARAGRKAGGKAA